MRYVFAVLLLASPVVACSSGATQLTPSAADLILVSKDLSGCEYLGNLTARHGSFVHSWEHNRLVSTRQIRNEAADKGATHLVLTEPVAKNKPRGGTGRCGYCSTISVKAYDCGG